MRQDETSKTNTTARAAESLSDAVELRLPSDPKILKVVRLTISYLAELVGFEPEERSGITLAVDEACANIIRHAYNGRNDRPILIAGRLLDDGLEIVLQDFGKKAKKGTIKSRDLDDVRPGGLGVHLITSVMDRVTYDLNDKGGNRLTLIKRLRLKKEGA